MFGRTLRSWPRAGGKAQHFGELPAGDATAWAAAMMRAGRMLAQGDLVPDRAGAIFKQPRHGYEIIKLLETRPPAVFAES